MVKTFSNPAPTRLEFEDLRARFFAACDRRAGHIKADLEAKGCEVSFVRTFIYRTVYQFKVILEPAPRHVRDITPTEPEPTCGEYADVRDAYFAELMRKGLEIKAYLEAGGFAFRREGLSPEDSTYRFEVTL